MGWSPFAPKAPAADTSYQDAEQRRRDDAASAASIQQATATYSAYKTERRLKNRNACTKTNHDNCLSH
jgi:hypothetical protein